MKKRRALFIEILVVILVLVILLIVTIPRFMGSQVRVKVAQAFQDLETIRKAMKVYNQAHPREPIEAFYLQAEYETEMPLGEKRVIQTLSQTADIRVYQEINSLARFREKGQGDDPNEQITDPFILSLDSLPVPQLPMELNRGRGNAFSSGALYAVDSRYSRNRHLLYESHPLSMSDHAEMIFHWYHGGYDCEYLGVASGPLDNQEIYAPGTGAMHTMFYYYVPYDPSNGVVSHGFLVSKMDPVPEEQRLDGKPPLPEEQRKKTFRYPLQEDPAFLANAAPAQPNPAITGIVDVTSVYEKQKQEVDSLELHMRGQFVDYWGIDNIYDLQHQIRRKVLEGRAPGSVTMGEVDRFFKDHRYWRRYPLEFICYKVGNQARLIRQTPRGARFPWEQCEEILIERSDSSFDLTKIISLDHTQRTYYDGGRQAFPVSWRLVEFDPVSYLYPLTQASKLSAIQVTPAGDGLYRFFWEDLSGESWIWKRDCLLDSRCNWAVVKSMTWVRTSYDAKSRRRFTGSSVPALTPTDVSFSSVVFTPTKDIFEIIYTEAGDYRQVKDQFIPRLLQVTTWKHYNPDTERYIPEAPGVYKTLEVPNPIDGDPLPKFRKQWTMEVLSARINEPGDESFFKLSLDGYQRVAQYFE